MTWQRGSLVLLAALGTLALTHAVPAQRTVAEQYLFRALNTSRSAAGLPRLAWSDRLTRAASQHAEVMGREEVLAHRLGQEEDLPERAAANGVRFSIIAENIGVGPTVTILHDSWIHSPSHLGNILDPAINEVGIAVHESGGDIWGVEDFAGTAPELSLPEQELRINRLLFARGVTSTGTDAARVMCRLSTGYVGVRPVFVMRFQATDLTHLPVELQDHLSHATQAAVGACQSPQGSFSTYSIAVALYR